MTFLAPAQKVWTSAPGFKEMVGSALAPSSMEMPKYIVLHNDRGTSAVEAVPYGSYFRGGEDQEHCRILEIRSTGTVARI